MNFFFEKVNFEKIQQTTKKHVKNECVLCLFQYLIEWGCDVMTKNIKGQSILETIKNDDFKQYAMDIYDYYSHIVPRIMNGDMELLDQVLADHISKKREFCCLRSRYVL